jgi:hypothetical protein
VNEFTSSGNNRELQKKMKEAAHFVRAKYLFWEPEGISVDGKAISEATDEKHSHTFTTSPIWRRLVNRL